MRIIYCEMLTTWLPVFDWQHFDFRTSQQQQQPQQEQEQQQKPSEGLAT
jgi:hypothetical protein